MMNRGINRVSPFLLTQQLWNCWVICSPRRSGSDVGLMEDSCLEPSRDCVARGSPHWFWWSCLIHISWHLGKVCEMWHDVTVITVQDHTRSMDCVLRAQRKCWLWRSADAPRIELRNVLRNQTSQDFDAHFQEYQEFDYVGVTPQCSWRQRRNSSSVIPRVTVRHRQYST